MENELNDMPLFFFFYNVHPFLRYLENDTSNYFEHSGELSWEYTKQIDLKVKSLKGPHALHSAENKEKDWSSKFHQQNINYLFWSCKSVNT